MIEKLGRHCDVANLGLISQIHEFAIMTIGQRCEPILKLKGEML
jgi:hypothetical protein